MTTLDPQPPSPPRWKITDYLEAVLRRPFHLAIPFLVIVSAVAIWSLSVDNMYRSSTLLLVESERVPESFVTQTTPSASQRLATILQEILSRTRLEKIINELDPYPEMMGEQPLMKVVESMRENVFVRVRGEDAFLIEFVHTDPEMAMTVTNRLATLFIEETTKARHKQAEQVHEFVASQVTQSRQDLEGTDRALREFKQKYMGALPQQLGANLGTLQGLQLELQTTNQALQATESRRILLDQNLAEERQRAGLSTNGSGPAAREQQLVQLRSELAAARSRYTADHPDVSRLRVQIVRLQDDLSAVPAAAAPSEEELAAEIIANPAVAAVRSQIQDAEVEIESLKLRRADAEEKVARLQSRIQRTPRVEQELTALSRDYDKMEDNYLALLSTQMEAEMAEELEERWKGEVFRMLDPAFLPERPFYPNHVIFLTGGIIFGLIVGIGVALLAEYFDSSVKSVRELQALVPCPVWITLPHVEARRGANEDRQG